MLRDPKDERESGMTGDRDEDEERQRDKDENEKRETGIITVNCRIQ